MNKKFTQKIDNRLSLEKGTIYKNHGGKIRIALVYPNVYRIGMSNLGFQGIYGLLNSSHHVVCERAFLPDDEDYIEHQRTRLPILSYETKTPLHKFDIIAFSISFEMDYINILKILSICKIPLFAKDRNKNNPLVIAGGVCCSSNPEPFAEFFDIIFIGEGEELVLRFVNLLVNYEHNDKEKIFKNCLNLDGIYIPSCYEVSYDQFVLKNRKHIYGDTQTTVKKTTYKEFCDKPITTVITTPEAEFSNMHLIEVMRGCYWGCRFCLVGSLYNPVRVREIDILHNMIIELNKSEARIGLIAPSLTDYKYLNTILSFENVCLSITSIRANSKAFQIIDALKGIKSISIAPETGNDRLRGVINKKIKDEDILSTSEYILNKGVETLRLYFMIGLPTETQRDIEDIINLTQKIRALSKKAMLSITISIFVPKPFTPFQWHGFVETGALKSKLSYITNAFRTLPKTTLRKESIRDALMQAIFSRGGRYLSKKLSKNLKEKNNNEILCDKGLKKHFSKNWQIEDILPWEFIEYPSLNKEQLWGEYIKALDEGGASECVNAKFNKVD